MAKKVAVLAVNPVNGFGLFQYLEAFFENGISYKVFAVAPSFRTGGIVFGGIYGFFGFFKFVLFFLMVN